MDILNRKEVETNKQKKEVFCRLWGENNKVKKKTIQKAVCNNNP